MAIEVLVPNVEVAFGEGFDVEVVRVWRDELDPAPWDDAALAPLVARSRTVAQHRASGRTMEVRQLTAHAFGLPEVAVKGVAFRAAAPLGETREVVSADVVVRVRSALGDASSASPVEAPEPLAEPPWIPAWMGWTAVLATTGAAALWLLARRRRRAVPAPEPAPAADAAEPAPAPAAARRALAQLRALRAESRSGDDLGLHDEAAGILRQYLHARFAWPAEERTTPEILADAAALDPPCQTALAATLDQCDLVKFAAWRPGPDGAHRMLDSAEGFVTATADDDLGEPTP